MPDPAYYCSAVQVVEMAGKKAGDTKHSTLIESMRKYVYTLLDNTCGTWFDSRERIVYTEAASDRQNILVMPAPIIAIDAFTEQETAVAVGDYQKTGYGVRRINGLTWGRGGYTYTDGVVRPMYKITGHFGFSAVPDDITLFAADLCAILGGLKTKTFTTGEGVAQTVNITTAPTYIKQSLLGYTWTDMSGQERIIETVPAA